MNNETPKVRFPEFRGEWEKQTIGSVCELKNGYPFKRSDYIKLGNYKVITIGNVQAGNFSSEDANTIARLPQDIQNHQILKIDDILISLTGNVGRVCKVTEQNCLLNQRVGKLTNCTINNKFLYQVLQHFNFRFQMQLNAKGGAQGNLSNIDILEYNFCCPKSSKEQQKIAACLSSLDDLINAESKKIAALKKHKKGLMQELFPAEGEALPKRRFSGFRGEWEKKPLSLLLDYERPDKYIVSNTNYQNNGIPVLTANKSFVLGYTNEIEGTFQNLPVIIFDDFTTDKKYVDFQFKVKSSAIKILKSKGGNNLKFIFESMNQLKFDPTGHKRYYISEYQNLYIAIPSLPEQQKIAACLSSLDDLINAESRKLEALKKHKKGLLQQLFPTLCK